MEIELTERSYFLFLFPGLQEEASLVIFHFFFVH